MKRKLFEIGNKLFSDFYYDKRGNERLQVYIRTSVHLDIKLSLSPSLCLSFSFTRSPIFNVPLLFPPPGWQMGSSDSHSSEECPPQGGYTGLRPSSSGSEEGTQELLEVDVQPQISPPSLEQHSPAHFTGNRVNIMVLQHHA